MLAEGELIRWRMGAGGFLVVEVQAVGLAGRDDGGAATASPGFGGNLEEGLGLCC